MAEARSEAPEAQNSEGSASLRGNPASRGEKRFAGEDWASLSECTSILGIRILLFAWRQLGRRPFEAMLFPVLAAYWLASPRLRRVVTDWQRRADAAEPFLERQFGSPRPGFRSGLAQLRRFSLAILEKFAALSSKDPAGLEVIGAECFAADGAAGGAVILTAHTGCQELLSQSSAGFTNHPIVILQHTAHARRFNVLLERAGARLPNIRIIEISAQLSPALVMELSELAAQGAYIVLAGDRTPLGSESFETVSFFGSPARFPSGGALLAQLLRMPLRMMVCTRPTAAERRYRVCFTELASADEIRAVTRRTRAAWLHQAAERYTAELERALRTSPLDWANFYDFWEKEP